MSLRNTIPIAWRPEGITDAVDASTARKGSMQTMQNLIPDPSTLGVWVCRPAAQLLVDFNTAGPFSSGFSSGCCHTFFAGVSAGNITCMRVFGNRAYGMVSGPGNFDYPFVYDLIQGRLIAVTNFNTTTLLPVTFATSGDWIPPSIAQVGTKVVLTHPGFTGGGTPALFFGWWDISNAAVPVWNAGDVTGPVKFVNLGVPPQAVENFNGRAYYAVNAIVTAPNSSFVQNAPALMFSKIMDATTINNATDALTFDDQTPLTALTPLPLNNQVTGGIVQAIMVFKGSAAVYQVTGDSALNNLAKNALNVASGTLAPLSTAVTTQGIGFASPDGFRMIDFTARVSDPLGWDGQGKTLPFIMAKNPSRMVAAATGTAYRVSVTDASLGGAPTVEYWLDTVRGLWSGPHTFPAQAIDSFNNTFIMSAAGVPGKLWRSDIFQSSSSTFIENGTQLQWNYTTSMMPDTDQMSENAMVETTLYMSPQPGVNYPVIALGPKGDVLGQGAINIPATLAPPLWGQVQWGSFQWASGAIGLLPRQIPWTAPVVGRRWQIQAN